MVLIGRLGTEWVSASLANLELASLVESTGVCDDNDDM